MAKKQHISTPRENPKAPHNQAFMGAPQRWDAHSPERMRIGKTRMERKHG